MKMKLFSLFPLFIVSACTGKKYQSIWYPVTKTATEIKSITWFLIGISTIILLAVMILLVLSLLKNEKDNTRNPGKKFVLWSGLIIPSVILLIMLFYSLNTTMKIREYNKETMEGEHLLIKVTGHQWWWEVEYPQYEILTANEIYVPSGRPVRFELSSKDVIHSFWIPNIHGKMDMIPGMKTYLNAKVDDPGVFRGQCAEYCGLQHSFMSLYFVAQTEEDFKKWTANRKEKITPLSTKGKEVFFKESCHTCHAIKNTEAMGKAGPDLTHISSRLSLGAGTISNNRNNLRMWILNSHEFKPKNRMPTYDIPAEELEALLDYLEELR
ncbi:MAG: cytochrome c oxidase subunit II [Bacteriovoracia bacterium]